MHIYKTYFIHFIWSISEHQRNIRSCAKNKQTHISKCILYMCVSWFYYRSLNIPLIHGYETHKTLVLIFSTTFVWNTSHSYKISAISEKYSNVSFINIRPVEAEVFHADGHTDRQTDRHTDRQTDRQTWRTKLIVSFCNSAPNVPKDVL